MPKVKLYGHIARYSSPELTVASRNVRELLEDLCKLSGSRLGELILDSQGKLREFIRIYVNQTDIRYLAGLETELSSDDVVTIMPALAGG